MYKIGIMGLDICIGICYYPHMTNTKTAAPTHTPFDDNHFTLCGEKGRGNRHIKIHRTSGKDVDLRHMDLYANAQRTKNQRDELIEAAGLAVRNEILRGALSECAAREQDRARMTVEAIEINRRDAKAYREEIQGNMRTIRAAIASAADGDR